MSIKHLLKRVAIDLGVILGVVLLAGGTIAGHLWIKEKPERAKAKREAEAFFADLTAQRKALIALGDVNLEPESMTLTELEKKLHQPALRRAGSQNTTTVGWACGGERCAISASFLIPFGQEIPPSTVPAALSVVDPLFRDVGNIAVGGVHLREPVDEVKVYCQKRGYGREIGYHRMTWGKDWTLIWGELNGKVAILNFANNQLIRDVRGSSVHPLAAAGTRDWTSK